jgi:hypothetical protein
MYFSSAATACSTALSFLQLAAVAVTLLTFSRSKLRKLLGRVLRRDAPMDKSQNRARKRDTAELAALVEEIIAYWKELARKRFYSHQGVDPDAFEQLWPQILDNFFLAETVRVARKLRFLSQGPDN